MTSDALAAEWQVWIADALIRGRPRAEIASDLAAHGLDPARADAEITALAASPGVIAGREVLRPRELVRRLRREHLALAPFAVPVRANLDAERFLTDHVAAQHPVVLPDLTAGWAARAWTWEGLVERLGDVVIDVCEGRAQAESPDRRYRAHVTRRPFREVVARVLDPSTGNDLYVVANNKALEGPLAALLDDVGPAPAAIDPARVRVSSVWIGPAGAKTPLHHDTSDIVSCHFLGAKRIRLAPPEEVEIAEAGRGFWAGEDVDAVQAERVVREATVQPGDALLIPSGWWHQVESLEPNISLTFAGLRHRNDFRWFRPAPPDLEEEA